MDFPSYPKTAPRQFALLPNNILTRLWFWYLSRYMNTDRYRLTKRGRKPKRPELRGYGGNVRLENAKRIGLYIDDKSGNKMRDYWLKQGRYDERMEAERRAKQQTDELKAKLLKATQVVSSAIFFKNHRQN